MSAPILRWYNTSEVQIAAALSFTSVAPGTPSAAQEVWLINNKDGVDAETARNLRLKVLVRDPGETDYQADGREFVDDRYVEVRIKGGYNQNVQTTAYTKLGAGSYLSLPELANDEGVKLEIRANTTLDASTDAVEVLFRIHSSESEALATGHTESGPDGVLLGLGDGSMSYLLKIGSPTAWADLAENPSAADDQVFVPDVVAICAGEPHVKLEHLYELDDVDGDAATLASGESYYALLYVDTAGAVTDARGSKVTDPLTEDDKPDPPADCVATLAYVKRAFDGIIEDADIENVWSEGAYTFLHDGLTGYVGPGKSRVDNSITSHDYYQTVTLTDDATNYLWRQKDGSLAITTDGSKPSGHPRARLDYVLTVAGGVVTATQDRRRFIGGAPLALHFRWDSTLAGGQQEFAVLYVPQGARLRPLRGVAVALDDQGSGTSSGATTFDFNYSYQGGSWTTLYTSQGSEDRRPSIAYDATDCTDSDSQPEVVTFKGGIYRFRADVDAIPSGGTAPSGASAVLMFEEC